MARTRDLGGTTRLVGARCTSCGHVTFPTRARCPSCRSDAIEEALLGPGATVQSTVELFVSTDESEAPYTLGLVTLDDGPTLLARIDGAAATGARVHVTGDVGADVFWFASENGSGHP